MCGVSVADYHFEVSVTIFGYRLLFMASLLLVRVARGGSKFSASYKMVNVTEAVTTSTIGN